MRAWAAWAVAGSGAGLGPVEDGGGRPALAHGQDGRPVFVEAPAAHELLGHEVLAVVGLVLVGVALSTPELREALVTSGVETEAAGTIRLDDRLMEVIPSIDLKAGRCVRLFQGDYQQETVYSDDPLAVAAFYQEQGAPRLHLVDLDGAAQGNPANLKIISDIVNRLNIPVQVGGGVRTLATAETLLSKEGWKATRLLGARRIFSHRPRSQATCRGVLGATR